MSKLVLDITTSLDGFVAAPEPSLDAPLGRGGEALHEWAFGLKTFQDRHGGAGGEVNGDDALIKEHWARLGATVMGRRMYSGGAGAWEDDPRARGWWGDDPPFHHPVFVLTHHPREPLEMEGGTTFTFVTDGIESALEQAREAAGGRDVAIGGGADVAQQYLRAGLVDELTLHIAPIFLGDGRRLFEGHLTGELQRLERTRVLASPSGVVHVGYRLR
jgi:dihydrofolate reductase